MAVDVQKYKQISKKNLLAGCPKNKVTTNPWTKKKNFKKFQVNKWKNNNNNKNCCLWWDIFKEGDYEPNSLAVACVKWQTRMKKRKKNPTKSFQHLPTSSQNLRWLHFSDVIHFKWDTALKSSFHYSWLQELQQTWPKHKEKSSKVPFLWPTSAGISKAIDFCSNCTIWDRK